MSGDNFDEMARKATKAAEQMQRIVDNSAANTLKKFVDQSPLVQIQRALECSSAFQAHRFLADEAARRVSAFESIAAEAARRVSAFESMAAERLSVLHDSSAFRAAERIREALENSVTVQTIARLESTFSATDAARRYLDEQAAHWQRMRNSLVHEQAHLVSPQPLTVRIKARIPKIRISPQAKQEYIPAPAAEPKIEMPPVHWLASALGFVLTKGTFKRTVEPILIDIYDEYCELINKGDDRRAKWIVVRGWFLVIWGQIERPVTALKGFFGL